MRKSATTKYRELRDHCERLWKENQRLKARINSITPDSVPFTIEQPYPIGTTVQVRLPKPFLV